MKNKALGAPQLRPLRLSDLSASLRLGGRDLVKSPVIDLFFASVFVLVGLVMAWVTYETGQTFWLILAVLGFPLVGTLAVLGFYETSRRIEAQREISFAQVLNVAWSNRTGQLPWLAAIIVMIFLFWFFLGHMIFALFLGLTPMTNILSSFEVFLRSEGLAMLAFGGVVGAVFALLVFAVSVLGIPMLLDRDVDFITAMIRSMRAVIEQPLLFMAWGLFVAIVTLVSMVPLFLGLFITMPILGHATWHLYARLSADDGQNPE
ncbi:MAG: DUF2189 domain-containing protein [Pikeienuella sp.]